jgi:hypothetical protein
MMSKATPSATRAPKGKPVKDPTAVRKAPLAPGAGTAVKGVDWRMTVADPVSVDINLTDLKSEANAPLDLPDHSWLGSSFELRHGLHVREVPLDKLADNLSRPYVESGDRAARAGNAHAMVVSCGAAALPQSLGATAAP